MALSDVEDDLPPDPVEDDEDGAYLEDEDDDTYWAAKKGKALACEIKERSREYYGRMETTGALRICHETNSAFYGLSPDGEHETSQVIEFGENGEKLGIRSNQLRSLVKFVYLSATADRPTIKPRASNNTAQALAQVPTARKILDYYDRVKRMSKVLNGAALRALLYGKGYVWESWDPSIGKLGQDGKPEGDLLSRACSPLDVVCDLDVEDEHDWFIVRVRRNRWDLAAIHGDPAKLSPEGQSDPELVGDVKATRQEILSAPRDMLPEETAKRLRFRPEPEKERKDTIFEYHFMHRRTPALPNGRYAIIIAGDHVLYSGDLPYETLPISEMCPEEWLEQGALGYSSAWDLLGMQSAYDSVLSVCLTNHEAWAHNDILIPEGSELSVEEIYDGLNVIRYPMGEHTKPSMLEKFSIKDEAFKLKDWLKGDMELALSVNSVARGEPEKSLESGAALALIQAQAIQAQSPFVAAFHQLIESVGSNRIKILKKHLQPERVIAIAGGDDPDSVHAFSVQDIDQIDRIEVEAVNPLFRTIAGRQNAADKLMERDMLPDAAAYIHFQETGRLESVTDDARQDDLWGHQVREALLSKPQVTQAPPDPMDPLAPPRMVVQHPALQYMWTDPPHICMKAAKDILRSTENRKDTAIVQAATAYMTEVMRVWRGTDPASLQLLGYPAPPPPVMPGMSAEPGAEPPKPGGGAPPRKPQDQKSPPEGSSMPSMPKQAQDPLGAAA
jgi:hypothetical protein